jgi:serine O-acetyltransferase
MRAAVASIPPRAGVAGPDPERPAWESFRADAGRYLKYAGATTLRQKARILLHTEGVWASAVYRMDRWLIREAPPLARTLLKLPVGVLRGITKLAVGIYLDPLCRIGPGLYIGHSGSIWVAPGAVIGRECNLSQGVTLGLGGTLRRGAPRLGDRVWVGPKATVSGPVVVGAGAVIGANSLVVSNVPERGVAVGVPARVVALSGSAALIG